MKINFGALIKSVVKELEPVVLAKLEEEAVKFAIKTFLKSGAGAGLQAWLVKFAAEFVVEEFAEPTVKAIFVEIGYTINKVEGNILIKRLKSASEGANGEDYDSTTDDVNN